MEKTTFLPLLHTEFRVNAGGPEPVTLTLAQVSDLNRLPDQETRRGKHGFALLFKGTREHLLRQRMYTFEHDALGTLELFIVPVHPDDDQSFSYEAIFNFL